ncbi:DUF397 domain-containing protein [Streptomyces beigongshangae]|uniref:DUF397 domain-containing protein n=1 Tax=Streptomyces beigongshangae TaxID=2841597 RepID=UPI001C855E06|nr:DUF397 domain-containing protein [Streptomyces sp. REN17]
MRTVDLTAASWRRSSYSNQDGGARVEVSADSAAADVPVRDSEDPYSPVLVFPAAGWTAFIPAARDGRLN